MNTYIKHNKLYKSDMELFTFSNKTTSVVLSLKKVHIISTFHRNSNYQCICAWDQVQMMTVQNILCKIMH